MLFHKQINHSTKGDVAFANGTIQFQSVKLNVYSFVTDGIAIDSGSHSLRNYFHPLFEEHPIEALYCTHIHEDHTGCAVWFQQRNIPIYIHESSIPEANEAGKYPMYRKLFWGKRKAFSPQPVPETFESSKYKWQSIFTPGHSSDHMAYLNTSTGQLYSGDLFVQVKTKLIMENESIPQIIQSIHKVLTYDFEELFCNHAGYVKEGRQRLLEKLEYLEQIKNEVQQLHKLGLTAKDIQLRLFPRKYPITPLSFGQWDSKHIVTSILK